MTAEQNFEENRRDVLSNEQKVPVGRGRCKTTSNALSRCARVSRRKADTLNTNLAGSLRPLLFVLVNDFNVYQRLLLIFVAVSVIKLIFVQQCFTWFVHRCGGQYGISY